MRPLSVCLLTALTATVLAACGGGKSDEDQITEVIQKTATTTSVENCTRLATQRFVEQTTFDTGAAAIKSCEQPTPGSNAKSVRVSSVQVNGDHATAAVAVSGGSFDGQTLKISLLKQDGQWKVDHIDAFLHFDQQKLAAALEKGLSSGNNAVTPSQASCVASGFANASPDAVKTVILSGQASALVPVLRKCGLG